MTAVVIPRTPDLDAALAALDVHTSCAPVLARLIDDTADDWPVVLETFAGWTSWPVREQMAFAHFLDAAWQARLSAFPASLLIDDAESVLCGLAHACDGIRMFLDSWVTRTDQAAMRHLADLVANNVDEIAAKGRLRNAFWEDRSVQMRQVVRWLHEPAVADALDLAYFAAVDSDVRGDFSAAADRLRSLQPAR